MGNEIRFDKVLCRLGLDESVCSYKKPTYECSPRIFDGLSKEELCFINIICWLRNRNCGLKGCMSTETFPGPRGHHAKNGFWFPDPTESCDAVGDVRHFTLDQVSGKERYNVFAMKEHCRTRAHIAYLYKVRPHFFQTLRLNTYAIKKIALSILNDEVPLLINSKDLLTINFFTDFMEGRYDKIISAQPQSLIGEETPGELSDIALNKSMENVEAQQRQSMHDARRVALLTELDIYYRRNDMDQETNDMIAAYESSFYKKGKRHVTASELLARLTRLNRA